MNPRSLINIIIQSSTPITFPPTLLLDVPQSIGMLISTRLNLLALKLGRPDVRAELDLCDEPTQNALALALISALFTSGAFTNNLPSHLIRSLHLVTLDTSKQLLISPHVNTQPSTSVRGLRLVKQKKKSQAFARGPPLENVSSLPDGPVLVVLIVRHRCSCTTANAQSG